MEEVGGRGVLIRELFAQKMPLVASILGHRGWWWVTHHCVEPASWPPFQPPAQGQWTVRCLGHAWLLGPQGRVRGGNSHSFPLVWGEGFLFSVPAVYLLFNLNTQPLHPSCIPEREGGCSGSQARGLGNSSASLLLQASREIGGEGCQVLLSWAKQAVTHRCHWHFQPHPPSSSHPH